MVSPPARRLRPFLELVLTVTPNPSICSLRYLVKLGSSTTTDTSPGRPGQTFFGLSSTTVVSIANILKRLFSDPKLFWTLASLVVIADVALTQLIIRFIPCTSVAAVCYALPSPNSNSVTEIDWETYMHQVKVYLDGERDYSAISGPTGPLVSVVLCEVILSQDVQENGLPQISRRTRLHPRTSVQAYRRGQKPGAVSAGLRLSIHCVSDAFLRNLSPGRWRP